MKKVLFILGELSDDDIDWMIAISAQERVPAGTILIQEGQLIDALYIVIDGTLTVSVAALGDREVAQLSSGEVVGEMSFVDERPPSATVAAAVDSLVMTIPREELVTKLQQDVGFASRFYRALAIFLSDRLRGTVSRLVSGKEPSAEERTAQENSMAPNIRDNLALGGTRFDWLMRRLRGIDAQTLE
ncbi:MAG: cyclic nucleotide-binding domain-containing protein [Trichocoleus desertorum ATA4-8-CV12]|jgi:bacteriocin-type transport-associated protein|nr:cyclic nucleotide-binding domain-containing protein [Trichocoleus desertorum ATA4-8-CV12]